MQDLVRGKAEFEHVREMPLANPAKGRKFEGKYGNCSSKRAFVTQEASLYGFAERGFGGDDENAAEQIQALPDYRGSAV